MSRCCVPRCKKTARFAANLCADHWANVPEHEQLDLMALRDGSVGGLLAQKQAYALAQGRIAMRFAETLSRMKRVGE